MASKLDNLFGGENEPVPEFGAPVEKLDIPKTPESTKPVESQKTPENSSSESDALHSVFSQMKHVGQITPNLAGKRPVKDQTPETVESVPSQKSISPERETSKHLDRAEIVDQLALSDDGSSSDEELCMDIGDAEPEVEQKINGNASNSVENDSTTKTESKITETKEECSELNSIWSKSLKQLSSIEELIQAALGASKPKFLALYGETIHLSVAKFKDEEIIPDQWLKFILAQNNNDNFCQRLRGEIISQLKACTNLDEVEKLDCHPVFAKVEALTLIWLLTIKTREGVFGDVLEVLLLFVSYAQRSTLDKIMFSGAILWSKKIIPEIYNDSILTSLLSIVPYVLFLNKKDLKVEVGDKLSEKVQERKIEERISYHIQPQVAEKMNMDSYAHFWSMGKELKPTSFMQNGRFNVSIAGLKILCASVGVSFAEKNLKSHLCNLFGHYEQTIGDETEKLPQNSCAELIHAICHFDCFGAAFGQTRDKEIKKMLKGLRRVLENYSKMPSAGNCPNKTLVADHATLQLVMMSRHIESVRKSIFDDIDSLSKTRKLPECILQLVDEIKNSS